MDLKEVKELIELVSEKGFAEFEIEHAGFRLHISRFKETPPVVPPASIPVPPSTPLAIAPEAGAPATTPSSQPATNSAPPAKAEAAVPEVQLHIIKSPIVGTFYRSPSPETPPFVEVGSRLEPETVVCIIEAMKLMNEIQAEIRGVVRRIYIGNNQAVEYGQPLFGIELD